MRHTTSLAVRGYHLDVYGHVNNARYLEFLEEARWRFFEEQAVIESITGEELAMVVVNININYRRAALIHEELEIATEVTRVGNKSFVIHQEIAVAKTGEMIADTDGTYVLFDNKLGRAVVIEGEYKVLLDKLCG
ncbi:acyl-CoA thioesterase [Litoribrevibacter albus]|uniref:Thioesterase n=1 Tax=Litoribrevibacter albus TaxID=1473156 RepID=A0AA37W8B8_9GAMM|nr:thioesterase family protein [Litoribrevibacter albus]GLQ33700.1 thioesterase [Litoribrevibacter albus]